MAASNVKQASRKRIAVLICTQLKTDKAAPPPATSDATETNKHHATIREPQFTYHFTRPKGNPTPALITQEKAELLLTAAAITENTSWRLDGKIYGKNNINPPLAGISQGALIQFMGNAFLEELKRTTVNATPFALKEVASGVVHPVTKDIITKEVQETN